MRRLWWKNQSTKQWEHRILDINEVGKRLELACTKQLQSFVTDVSAGVILERNFPGYQDKPPLKYWNIYRPSGDYSMEESSVPAQILLYLLLEGASDDRAVDADAPWNSF